MKVKHVIDLHKGLTAPVMLGAIVWFGRWDNYTAWAYLAMHGSYGICWLLKSHFFGDRAWEERVGALRAISLGSVLSLYWVAGIMISWLDIRVPPWYLAVCTMIFALGIFFQYVSDMQKAVELELRPGLITDRLFSFSRNPNYLGELLVYLGLALLARHYVPLLVLAFMVLAVWLPRWVAKERSLSRYPEFHDYRAHTGFLTPRLAHGVPQRQEVHS